MDWRRDGKSIVCRICKNEYNREYYRTHRKYAKRQGEKANARKKRVEGGVSL